MTYRMSYDPSAHDWFWEGVDRKLAVSGIAGLIELNRDASHGLRMMAEILEELPVAPELLKKAEMRDGFASKLAVLMAKYGAADDIPEGGTLRGKRFGWRMQIAAALSSDDLSAVLEVAKKGNATMQEEYGKVLDTQLPKDVRRVVLDQSREIEAAADWLEAQQDQPEE